MSRHQAVSELHFFVSILDTLFSDPDCLLSAFGNVSEEELDELWSWNSPLQPELRFCMHEKVSEQAALHPEKIAIDAWDGTLTYRQVEDYSTDLAQTLRLLDDSPNQIIPVLFEKSRWTSVAVLAVMTASMVSAYFGFERVANAVASYRTSISEADLVRAVDRELVSYQALEGSLL